MVIYWDLLIGSTLLVNYSFLKTIMIAFKQRVNWLRMIIALIFSLLSLGLFLLPSSFNTIRYFIGIVIGIIAFPSKKWKDLTIQVASFYLLNFAYIGSLIVFRLTNPIFLLISLFYIILLFLIEKINYVVLKNKNLTYNVNILGIKKELLGYYDTGNRSSYHQKPIVFLQEYLLNDSFKYIESKELIGLGGKKMIKLYEGTSLLINNRTFEVYYAFLPFLEYDIILNYRMEVSDD